VGAGVWAIPDLPGCAEAAERVVGLAKAGGGEVMILDSHGRTAEDSDKLMALFSAARADEWSEFLADCGKFVAEIAKEIAKDKLTMAELEEEEQSLERLRRWHHDLKKRDVFGMTAGDDALLQLRECNDRLDEYADLVYARTQQP
jgi:hypothetical protein